MIEQAVDSLANFPIMIFAIVLAICVIFLFAALYSWIKKSDSKEYRELLADMYVVGMIKQYATDDKIDLLAELKEYAQIQKRRRYRIKDLDSAIEAELKEKIANSNEKKLDKEKK